jgi:hypothetical protein
MCKKHGGDAALEILQYIEMVQKCVYVVCEMSKATGSLFTITSGPEIGRIPPGRQQSQSIPTNATRSITKNFANSRKWPV